MERRSVRWFAGVGIVVSGVTLSLLCAGMTYAQSQSFEQQLAAVAAKGIDRPVVAAIPNRPPQTDTGSENQPASLAAIAGRWGLKVFEQDGVYVLASPFSLDLSVASGAMMSAQMQDPDAMVQYLLASLDQGQMVALGSQGGLRYNQLRPDQQEALTALFSRDNSLAGPESDIDQPEDPKPIPADAGDVEEISLSGCLYASDAALRYDSESCVSISLAQHRDSDRNLLHLTWNGTDPEKAATAAEFRTENTLKRSELEYNRPELVAPVCFSGAVTLEKFIKETAAKTGLKLTAPAGSERVPLVIYSANCPAGRILKAVSLATQGTWRQVGGSYLFVRDAEGIGRITARENVRYARWNKTEADNSMILASRQWMEAISHCLPFDPTDSLQLSNGQVERKSSLLLRTIYECAATIICAHALSGSLP